MSEQEPLVALRQALVEDEPLAPQSDDAAAALIRAAMNTAQPTAVRARSSRRWPARRVLAALLLVFGVSGAAFAGWYATLRTRSGSELPVPATDVTGRVPPPTIATVPEPAEVISPDGGDASDHGVSRPQHRTKAISTASPRDLLAEANALRRKGEQRRAMALYRQILAQNSDASASYVAAVTLAKLLAARNPREAVTLFTRARRQSPRGALAPEIAFGLAGAYRSLGRAADERRELDTLVTRFGDTALGRQAKRRLAESAR